MGQTQSNKKKLKRGDLIEIDRGLYKHWAVYIGEDEVVHVVNLSDNSGLERMISKAEIKREKLSKVVGHNSYKVNNLLDDKYEPRDPDVIVKDACSRVGQQLPYNVVTKNCEHFATELRYGKAESLQVRKAVIRTTTGLLGLWIDELITYFTHQRGKKRRKKI